MSKKIVKKKLQKKKIRKKMKNDDNILEAIKDSQKVQEVKTKRNT